MKTKVIEAMSFGKSIIGTDEAFQGIECDYCRMGEVIYAIRVYSYYKFSF